MSCYLHSYYDSGTNKWYLSDITRKDDQLFVECLLCKQNIEIQTLDDNWKNNVLVKTSTTKLIPLTTCSSWKWLNSPCEHCVYFKKVKINVYKSAKGEQAIEVDGDVNYAYCNLRNELFTNHCHELFVDCRFDCKKSTVQVNCLISLELQQQYLSTLDNFFTFDSKGDLELKKKSEFFNSKYYALTPLEFDTLFNMTSQGIIMGSSKEFVLYHKTDPLSIENAWFTFDKISLESYYKLALENLCDIIVIQDLSICLIWGQNGCFMVGDLDVLNKYKSILSEKTTG